MPVRATKHFKIDRRQFGKLGAFDPWLDVDSPLFVDPTLLEACTIPEFVGSRDLVLAHYDKIFRLSTRLRTIKLTGHRKHHNQQRRGLILAAWGLVLPMPV